MLQALNIDPHYIDALLSLSQLELRRGRWERAEFFIKESLKQRPDLPDLYNYYGILFHKTGNTICKNKQQILIARTITPVCLGRR